MKKIIPIIILVLISAFFIFYRFSGIPKYLAFDEIEFTKLALSLQNKPYTPYSSLATGHSTLYFYILLASLKTFGTNVFALRFPAAIFGILSIIIFYLIMKRYRQGIALSLHENTTMKQWLPFFLSIIFLTSRWFLNFSRFSFEATFLLFLELTSIYFLLKFNENLKTKTLFLRQSPGAPIGMWRSKKTVLSFFYLVISGLFAGLAFISYTPGRIFFLLPMGFLILKWYRQGIVLFLLIFLIPFIITITPLTSYLLTHKDSRIDKLFFWKNHEMSFNEKIVGTVNNVKTISLMFFTNGDMNGKHNYPGKPALNPILGILLITGLLISIKNYKDLYNKLFLFYFLISLFPSLAIYPWENPNMLRTFTVIPSVIYFIGNTIYHLSSIVQRWSLNKRIPRYLILTTFYLILIFSSFYELRTYFRYQAPVFEHSFEIRYPLEKAIKMKNVYEKSN